MVLTQLYIPLEIAPQTIAEIGELGLLQINDLNSTINSFQRTFVTEIKKLNEIERKLRFLLNQAEKSNIILKPGDTTLSYSLNRNQHEIDQLDFTLTELESRILQMNNSEESLNLKYLELTEMRHVLRETATFFQNSSKTDELGIPNYEEDANLLDNIDHNKIEVNPIGHIGIEFIAGVIPRDRIGIFERVLFRALRGNLIMNDAEIEDTIIDPKSNALIFKNVFIIFAHGRELINKIKKISESMGATLYHVDDHPEKRRASALEVMAKIEDLRHVLENTATATRSELFRVSDNLEQWNITIQKEKAIFHAMNKMSYDFDRKALIGECWCTKRSLAIIKASLRTVMERTGSTIPPILNETATNRTPPTSQMTSKFTEPFQNIVDAYGVAKYGEVNPGIFTIITFPFLFAVMFGDLGHGFILSIFAGWMIRNENSLGKKNWGEIWDMCFGGRYIMILMGLFSMYTGLIYNDIFSQTMTLMSSEYTFVHINNTDRLIGVKSSSSYGFGVDPAWHGTENALIFSNSYKMKMSIIMGVVHMAFGMSLQCYNHIHFGKKVNIYLEFLPQILYFLSIFGYLVFMIIFKWLTYYEDASKAPGLLNTLIYMFLSPGEITMRLFPGQALVQCLLLIIAFVSVPWMLLGKPYYELMEYARTTGLGYSNSSLQSEVNMDGHLTVFNGIEDVADDSEGHSEEFDFSDAMIHQAIHTIEFTLSGISNTASYLRLWALSLAHAQLSEVLWDMMLLKALNTANGFAIVFGFFFWFVSTVAILICMEGLSAFLHALRLHW